MNHQKSTIFVGNDHMKRSPSELALEALVNYTNHDDHHDIFSTYQSDHDHHQQHHATFVDPTANVVSDDHRLPFEFKNQQDIINSFPGTGGVFDQQALLWYQNFNPQQPCVSATIDSQSSICAGSPTSILTKPKAGDNQGSGSSEDDEEETEAGQCEQSGDDPVHHDKRIRRMASNRESARRSRKRKQAQLLELEKQVEDLGLENSTLFKQLNNAAQQLRDASTNNRVLKSDVEALRAKVKLAHARVTRGPLNQLFQNNVFGSPSPQMAAYAQNLSRVGNVINPAIMVQGQEGSFDGAFSWQNSSIGSNNNMDHVLHGNASSGLGSDNSCVTKIWH